MSFKTLKTLDGIIKIKFSFSQPFFLKLCRQLKAIAILMPVGMQLSVLSIAQPTQSLSGLEKNSTRLYKIEAFNGVPGNFSTQISALMKPTKPVKPIGPIAQSQSQKKITISEKANEITFYENKDAFLSGKITSLGPAVGKNGYSSSVYILTNPSTQEVAFECVRSLKARHLINICKFGSTVISSQLNLSNFLAIILTSSSQNNAVAEAESVHSENSKGPQPWSNHMQFEIDYRNLRWTVRGIAPFEFHVPFQHASQQDQDNHEDPEIQQNLEDYSQQTSFWIYSFIAAQHAALIHKIMINRRLGFAFGFTGMAALGALWHWFMPPSGNSSPPTQPPPGNVSALQAPENADKTNLGHNQATNEAQKVADAFLEAKTQIKAAIDNLFKDEDQKNHSLQHNNPAIDMKTRVLKGIYKRSLRYLDFELNYALNQTESVANLEAILHVWKTINNPKVVQPQLHPNALGIFLERLSQNMNSTPIDQIISEVHTSRLTDQPVSDPEQRRQCVLSTLDTFHAHTKKPLKGTSLTGHRQ
jgi:hypothetical protein